MRGKYGVKAVLFHLPKVLAYKFCGLSYLAKMYSDSLSFELTPAALKDPKQPKKEGGGNELE